MTTDTTSLKTSPEGTTVDTENPWPGLLAYREEDQDFFHGRKAESQELLRLVVDQCGGFLSRIRGIVDGQSTHLCAGRVIRLAE